MTDKKVKDIQFESAEIVMKPKEAKKPEPTALNRQMRRAMSKQKKEEQADSWEDLLGIYASLSEGIVKYSQEMAAVITAHTDMPSEIKTKMTRIVQTAIDDLKHLADRVRKNYNRHATRKGKITSDKDIIESIDIFSEYAMISDMLSTLFSQHTIAVAEVIGEGKQAKKNETSEDGEETNE